MLVVDDNRDAASMMAMLLELHGHDVFVAHDAERALEAARDNTLDVALLDIGLPGVDGYELARRLRQQDGTRHLRLIAVTGWGQAGDRARASEAGFNAHLTKPTEPELLLSALEVKQIGKLRHSWYPDFSEVRMPNRNISLTPEQDAFVENVVEAGDYQKRKSEAIRDALRVLQQRRKEDRSPPEGHLGACKSKPGSKPSSAAILQNSMRPICKVTWKGWRKRQSACVKVNGADWLARPAQLDLANILSTSADRWGAERPATVRCGARGRDAAGRGGPRRAAHAQAP